MESSWVMSKKAEVGKLTVKGLWNCVQSLVVLVVYVFVVGVFRDAENQIPVWLCTAAVVGYVIWFFRRFSALELQEKRQICNRQIQNVEAFLKETELTEQELAELDSGLFELEAKTDVLFLEDRYLKLTDHFMIMSLEDGLRVDVVKADTLCSGTCSEEDEGYIDFDFYDADGRAIMFSISLSGKALEQKEQVRDAINTRYGKIISEGSSIDT